MANIATIRTLESGADRTMRAFDRALRTVERVMVKAAQLEGRKVHKRNARRFARGQFANRQGLLKRLGDYGPKWGKRKRRLKLDLRRGVAGKGILKTTESPKGYIRRPDGFVIDYTKPDITITRRATLGKSKRAIAGRRIIEGKGKARAVVGIGVKIQTTNRRSFRVNNYLGHYADAKAPGLGSITDRDAEAIDKVAADAVEAHLRSIQGATRSLSARARVSVNLRIGRLVR